MVSSVEQLIINDRYQILELLGSGSMGAVYRVEDRQTGAEIALKRVIPVPTSILASAHFTEKPDWQALKREFKMLAALAHPHIVRVMDCGFDQQGHPFYTMTYLKGQKLLDDGQDQPLSYQLELLRQLFSALAYLHERDILQRDLKPDNILVVDGQAKLTDFGLAACEAQFSGAVTNLQGTAAYMAPELLMGEQPSKATDLYAGGMIAYELIVGHHPFDVRNMNRLILSILHEEPDLTALPAEPQGLRALAGALLNRDPKQRPSSAGAVVKQLEQIKMATDSGHAQPNSPGK